MVHLFYGSDSYRRQKALNKTLSSVCVDDFYTSKRVYIDKDTDLERLYRDFRSQGLFSGGGKRVFVINGFGNVSKKDSKRFLDMIGPYESDKYSHIYFNESWPREIVPVDVRTFFKNIEYKPFFFKQLEPNKAIDFLMDDAVSRGIKIDKPATALIYEKTNYDMWMSSNEIDKLSLLYSEKEINKDIVASLVGDNIDTKIYYFVNIILNSSSASDRIRAFELFILKNPQYYGLFGYISKVNKDVHIMNLLTQSDIKIKLGFLDPNNALLELLLKI